MKPVEKALRRLRQALRTLGGTEGRPVARRNARGRVLTALRLVRAALDKEAPALRKAPTRNRTIRRDPKGYVDQKIARLRKADWREVSQSDAIAFAAAKAPMTRVAGKIQARVSPSAKRLGATAYQWVDLCFVPVWALAVGPDPKAIRGAKRSITERRHALAVAALQKD